MLRQSKFFNFVVWVRVCKIYDDILLSKILYDVTSSSSTSSLGIMRYCTAVDNRKDEKAWYKYIVHSFLFINNVDTDSVPYVIHPELLAPFPRWKTLTEINIFHFLEVCVMKIMICKYMSCHTPLYSFESFPLLQFEWLAWNIQGCCLLC